MPPRNIVAVCQKCNPDGEHDQAQKDLQDNGRPRCRRQPSGEPEDRRDPLRYLAGRFFGNLAKALGFALLAAINGLVWRTGAAKKALVRAWRSCGYLYQIPRSLLGKL